MRPVIDRTFTLDGIVRGAPLLDTGRKRGHIPVSRELSATA
jgi:hypothetical protein